MLGSVSKPLPVNQSRLGLLVALTCAGLAACNFSSSGGESPDANFDFDGPAFDSTQPDAEPDTAGPEAGADVTIVVDSTAPDVGVADVTSEATLADLSVPDVFSEAAPEDAAVDAGLVADATPDAAADSGSDSGSDGAPEAAASCIVNVFGDHTLRADGTVIYEPGGPHTEIVDVNASPLTPMLEVVQQTGDHACGLRGDGTVWCWPLTGSGGNTSGDLGNGMVGGTGTVGVATQVLVASGTPLTSVAHLSTASDTFYTFPTCAIRTDKTVWCWGFSTAEVQSDGLFQGSLGSNASSPFAIPIASGPSPDGGAYPVLMADQVSVGLRHACVLLAGKVSCWGDNVSGNLADGDPTLAFQPYPVAVVPGMGLPATVDSIGCGFDFTCALASGSVWCWGTDGWKQMANPSVPDQVCNSNYCEQAPVPVQQSLPDGGTSQTPDAGGDQDPLTAITKIVVGYQFACALNGSGNLWCWGANVSGVTSVPEAMPYTSAAPAANIVQVTALGEDWSALRYLTGAGVYVSGSSVVAPYCQ